MQETSCTVTQEVMGSMEVLRIPFGKEALDAVYEDMFKVAPDTHCPDCRVPRGGYHHMGCDREECPGCGGQALGCACYERGPLTSESRQAVVAWRVASARSGKPVDESPAVVRA